MPHFGRIARQTVLAYFVNTFQRVVLVAVVRVVRLDNDARGRRGRCRSGRVVGGQRVPGLRFIEFGGLSAQSTVEAERCKRRRSRRRRRR